jgi:hypothetical protein
LRYVGVRSSVGDLAGILVGLRLSSTGALRVGDLVTVGAFGADVGDTAGLFDGTEVGALDGELGFDDGFFVGIVGACDGTLLIGGIDGV